MVASRMGPAKCGLAGSPLHLRFTMSGAWRDEPASPFFKKVIGVANRE